MHIQQINTSAVLRQFATLFGNDLVEVKTKLGPMTVVSASFNLNDFPDDEEIQIEFLKSLSQKANPEASAVLGASADKCIQDQTVAVRNLLKVLPHPVRSEN